MTRHVPFRRARDDACPVVCRVAGLLRILDHEDLDDLKARFPAYTVLRKERALTEEQWNRVRFDKLTQALEVSGKDNAKAYTRRRDALAESVAQDSNEKSARYFRMINEIPAVFMIVIVIMVIVKPF